jgi:hypothetical protein
MNRFQCMFPKHRLWSLPFICLQIERRKSLKFSRFMIQLKDLPLLLFSWEKVPRTSLSLQCRPLLIEDFCQQHQQKYQEILRIWWDYKRQVGVKESVYRFLSIMRLFSLDTRFYLSISDKRIHWFEIFNLIGMIDLAFIWQV